MNKATLAKRLARFYDNGGTSVKGGSIDRFTAVYLRPAIHRDRKSYTYVGMSSAPFHPKGFGQHGESWDAPCDWPKVAPLGRRNHLGRRIRFQDLPEDCRKLVLQDLAE